jgi:long-chain acyl-CoA synthetase
VAAVLDAHAHGDLIALRTSGTSGSPRSVVRTTSSWFDSFPHVTRLLRMDADARVWVPGPLSATMNLFAVVHARATGAEVLPSRPGATHALLTPAGLARAAAQDTDLTGIHVLVAGDRLGRGLHDAAIARGAAAVSHYYGAAELSFVAWGTHTGDLTAFPGVEIDCADGLVWARSRYVCLRYDGPDGPLSRRMDGFVTVGDRGHVEDDRLRVRGRGTDTVVTAGATVLVGDVEAALEAATGHRVGVVGLAHPDLGQVLCAAVTDLAALEPLRRSAGDVLDAAQRPRRWFVLPDLPITPAGKLDRDRLAERLHRHPVAGGPDRPTVDTP